MLPKRVWSAPQAVLVRILSLSVRFLLSWEWVPVYLCHQIINLKFDDMKRLIFTWLFGFALLPAFAQKSGQIPTIYVDRHGVMRWSDTKEEASFFGVNYTLPFAHAYRAIGYLGMDRKQAIDRDVYHLARLGINAYRIHLWDVELSDERGNLLENEHLELMDYLLARLEERGIRIIITLQTNFGNGYP